LSPKDELEVGRKAAREIRKEYEGKILPDTDPQVKRVRRVTDRIREASEIKLLQKEINLRVSEYRFDWKSNVVEEKQVNAFCLPAGHIFVFTGILKLTRENEDYLATVLSHEVAHALAHHASERIANQQKEGKSVLKLFRRLSYEREQEKEADHIGVFLMTFAGYDPAQAVQFWQRMEEVSGGKSSTPELLSSHPSHRSRIALMRQWAPRAKAAKRAFDQGHVVRSE